MGRPQAIGKIVFIKGHQELCIMTSMCHLKYFLPELMNEKFTQRISKIDSSNLYVLIRRKPIIHVEIL